MNSRNITMPCGQYRGMKINKVPAYVLEWYYDKAEKGEPIGSIALNNAIASHLERPVLYLTTEAKLPDGKEIQWQSIKTLKEINLPQLTDEATREEICRCLCMKYLPKTQTTFIRPQFKPSCALT